LYWRRGATVEPGIGNLKKIIDRFSRRGLDNAINELHLAATAFDLMMRAGEAASLVLLTATALGLASCPIAEPLEVAQTRRRCAQLFSAPAITRRFCFVSVGRR
jgi:hypothetical protein